MAHSNERLRQWIDRNSHTELHYNPLTEMIWSYLHCDKLPSALQGLLSHLDVDNFGRRCSCGVHYRGSLEHAVLVHNYCPCCHTDWQRNRLWERLHPSVEMRLLTSYIMKQLVYDMFSLSLPFATWPHNDSSCPLCVLKSADHFREFLHSEYAQDLIDREADDSLCELCIHPADDQPQPLIVDQWYTIDHNITSLERYIADADESQRSTFGVTLSNDQQSAWWQCLEGDLQLECEVQYRPDEQVHSPRLVQVIGWHFTLHGSHEHQVPTLDKLSKACAFWSWFRGSVPRVKERLLTMNLRER